MVCLDVRLTRADTLHGFCVSPAPVCLDNGSITPTSANPPYFGFQSSGTTQGDFELVLLVPNDEIPSPASFSLKIDGSNVTNMLVSATLFSETAFSSGTLQNYLGLSYSPSNPFDHYLPLTQSVDALATGYYVYTFNFGAETGNPKTVNGAPRFSLDGGVLPLGSLLLGLELEGDQVVIGATNPSGAILATKDPGVPEPASAGLLGAALVMCYLVRKKVRVPR
jgi:hypothetical protein